MDTLEKVDEAYLRKVLNAPSSTPKSLLYLEMGCMPIQYIIKCRRLNFLHYILNKDENSMVNQVLQAQLENSNKDDWVVQIKK